MTERGFVAVRKTALDSFKRAVKKRHGRTHGVIGLEAEKALEAHARKLGRGRA